MSDYADLKQRLLDETWWSYNKLQIEAATAIATLEARLAAVVEIMGRGEQADAKRIAALEEEVRRLRAMLDDDEPFLAMRATRD